MRTITRVVDYSSGYGVWLINYCLPTRLGWYVATRPMKKDACCGCDFARRTYCGNPCCNTNTHFKEVREGDMLVTESGRRMTAVMKDAYHMIAVDVLPTDNRNH